MEIEYDFCILSLGSGVNFYNTAGANDNCFTVRTMHEALRLRSAIIKKLDDCDNDLNINIIGGGYTGVEVAGQLSHLTSYDLKKLYPNAKIKVRLIQATDSLVPQLPQKAREKILARLEKMGVEILFNTKVSAVEQNQIILSEGTIPNDIAVWSAGVDNIAANFIEENFCEKGQIMVNEFLQHKQFDSLYGAGDIICGHNISETGKFPQIGEAAYHEGRYIAEHISARINQKPLPAAFNFRSKGMLMPIGENYGIAVFGNIVIDGFFAWWLRRTVYLMFIPGYLRKIKLMINWTLNLFGFRYVVDIE
jgi:NADH dehydrogenase